MSEPFPACPNGQPKSLLSLCSSGGARLLKSGLHEGESSTRRPELPGPVAGRGERAVRTVSSEGAALLQELHPRFLAGRWSGLIPSGSHRESLPIIPF